MSGYFAVDRGIFSHEFFDAEPFTQREAWMWLISEAAWRDCVVKTKFGAVSLIRGQCIYSVRFLAERWQWDRSRVYRFLKALVDANSIRTVSEHGMQQITICQYEKYQGARTENEQRTNTKRDKEEPDNHRTKGSIGADAPADPAKILIDHGIALLARQNCDSGQARKLIGMWRKNLGDEMLSAIFDDVERNPKADLRGWIGGIIRFHKTGGQQNGVSEFRRAYEQAASRLASGAVEFGFPSPSGRGAENPFRQLPARQTERSADLHGGGDATIIQLSKFSRQEGSRSNSGDRKSHEISADDSGAV